MPSGIELGDRLLAWKSHRGCTLQAIADVCGVTRQAISLIFIGDRDIKLSMLEKICTKAFRIDLQTFFGPLPRGEAKAA